MNTHHDTTEQKLKAVRPVLNERARIALWDRIKTRVEEDASSPLPTHVSTPSPYFAFVQNIRSRRIVSLMLILVLVVSTGGVAYASESARPGDLLFPIDRAVEQARLSLARSDESRNDLLLSIRTERIEEIRSIIDEEIEERESGIFVTLASTSEVMSLEVEVDIFTDVTVVEVEINDRPEYFTTSATVEDDIIREVLARYTLLTDEQVRVALNLDREGRASRAKDRGEVVLRDTGRARVDEALKVVLPLILGESYEREEFARLLQNEIKNLDIEIDDDEFRVHEGRNRYERESNDDDDSDDREDDNDHEEIRSGEDRMTIEERDEAVHVRLEGENDDVRYILPRYEYSPEDDDNDTGEDNDDSSEQGSEDDGGDDRGDDSSGESSGDEDQDDENDEVEDEDTEDEVGEEEEADDDEKDQEEENEDEEDPEEEDENEQP